MSQDPTFRLLLLAGFIAVVAITLRHRIAAAATGERLDRRQEGIFILATLRPVAGVFWLSVIAFLINPGWMAWSSLPLAPWLRWTGVAIFASAVALLAWMLPSLGTNLTDTVVTRAAHTLVTHGPYRFVRHPFYDAMTLLILASSLMTANWFLLATGSLVVLLIVIRTDTEEAHLLARFGDAYRTYTMTTGRFLPRDPADRIKAFVKRRARPGDI